MGQKKKARSKVKPSKANKAKLSPFEKALRSLPSAAADFQKVLNGEPGYRRI
jgi:hypothetical protein